MAKVAAKKKAKSASRIELPNKMSELINLALGDLRAVEKMKKKYVVNMGIWHSPQSELGDYEPQTTQVDKCVVCFAGSVMAQTLKIPDDVKYDVGYGGNDCFDEETDRKLDAINSLRTGDIADAAVYLDIDAKDVLGASNPFITINDVEWKTRDVAVYSEDPAQFKKDMARLAKDLAAAGL